MLDSLIFTLVYHMIFIVQRKANEANQPASQMGGVVTWNDGNLIINVVGEVEFCRCSRSFLIMGRIVCAEEKILQDLLHYAKIGGYVPGLILGQVKRSICMNFRLSHCKHQLVHFLQITLFYFDNFLRIIILIIAVIFVIITLVMWPFVIIWTFKYLLVGY